MAKTLVPDADALHREELCAEGETITLVVLRKYSMSVPSKTTKRALSG